MKTTKAVLGVLAGMAAGAALGVLFAPYKGSKTRRKITKKGRDLADSLEELSDSMEDRIDQKFDELVSAINGRMKKYRSQAETEVNKNSLMN